MIDEKMYLERPCPQCLETSFTKYLKLIDMDKMLATRKKALTNQSLEICSFRMPMLLGSKGHVNYVFDGRPKAPDKKDNDE